MSTPMRSGLRWRVLGRHLAGALALILTAGACVLPASGPPLPRVDLVAGDPAAWRYGRTGADVLGHPEIAPRVRALFGGDWLAAAPSHGGTSVPAPDIFRQPAAPRLLRIADRAHIAVTGCAPAACSRQRGLLLIGDDGRELRARIDEGGFTHHYVFGIGLTMDGTNRGLVDSAWGALAADPGSWRAVP